MYLRGLAVCSILVAASIAQAGATVQLGLTPAPLGPNNCYVVNTPVTVDVQILQDPGGADQLIRMAEFDMATSNAFLGISLPLTHNRGTVGPSDDVFFWRFDSIPQCGANASLCSADHYIDDDMIAGPVDTRTSVVSAAFYGLNPLSDRQNLMPGGASPAAVPVGRLIATLPATPGSYTLNLMNAADPDANRRARLDFGFDPHIIWRAGQAAPNDLKGGTVTFTVANTCVSVRNPVSSVPAFTSVGNNIVPADGTLWRSQRNVIRVTFDGALTAAPTAGQLQIVQLLPAGAFGPDVSANGFTFTLESGNTVLRIADDTTSDFPHRTWFAIRNTGGWSSAANFELQFPVQIGDAGANNNVLAADVLTINSRVSCLVNCGGDQIREDINGDQRILAADVLEANSRVSSLPVPKPTGH